MRDERGPHPVTVPATTGPATVTILTSPHRLCGWSLASQDVTNSAGTGNQTAPAAGTVIASVAAAPQGEYAVEWTVQLTGTPGAGELDNFGLYVGATLVATSLNQGAVGDYVQETVTIKVPAGGATVAIKNIGIGTAGAIYAATLVLGGQTPTQGYFADGAQQVGVFGIPGGLGETDYLGDYGVYVGTQLNMVVNSGTVSGVVYVKDKFEYT